MELRKDYFRNTRTNETKPKREIYDDIAIEICGKKFIKAHIRHRLQVVDKFNIRKKNGIFIFVETK